MHIVNLGILAHVDAGKTSLTERLLHAAGVIDAVGRVDDGTTQTDSLALERQRGITIRAAVASFVVDDDVTVNLIDTPGHPDFIAEVERALGVLDGAVLVVSAVEGVQAQTRVLMRTVRRLRIPTLLFVNKVDRRGADVARVVREIEQKLAVDVVPMGAVRAAGTRDAAVTPYGWDDPAFARRLAEATAEHDEAMLAAYVEDEAALLREGDRVRAAFAEQVRRCRIHPVFAGSAVTGVGVDALTAGVAALLPPATGDARGPSRGSVFKVERGPAGERVAYVRMFSGAVRVRDLVRFGQSGGQRGRAKVTAVHVFDRGGARQRREVVAGEIAQLRGLTGVRIGDVLGDASDDVSGDASADGPADGPARGAFAPPSWETVVVADRPADHGPLLRALSELAEQDPLINVRQDDERGEVALSLYGEVQKEIIQATLAADYGLAVTFRETTTIHVERPAGVGEALEILRRDANPFLATVGLRVEPAPVGSGITFRLAPGVGVESIPLYVYGRVATFREAMAETVTRTLRQGLAGWQVTDCLVTLTRSGYDPPGTTARDVKLLTPLVLMAALRRAGTVVCEPILRFRLEAPVDTVSEVLPLLARLGAVPDAPPAARGPLCEVTGEVPARRAHEVQRRLPALTRGEGVLDLTPSRHAPVRGRAPARARTGRNPLNRTEYLLQLAGRVRGGSGPGRGAVEAESVGE
ncbi:GTP-binding protein [Streptomyces sp. 4N509B]|uniref:GTP-binding protein n=1 Tax=Streptomyces sp. 4N509B TaxID=3457413 RepID=UPI003FD697B1